nr:hypothetical protein [Alcaligenes faecalis]
MHAIVSLLFYLNARKVSFYWGPWVGVGSGVCRPVILTGIAYEKAPFLIAFILS